MNSSDELDNRLVLFHFKWWIPFVGILFLSIAALFWAIFTEIPTTFKADAIYLNDSGFEFVRTKIDGELTQVPGLGQKVEKGEVIAVVVNGEGKTSWNVVSNNSGEVIEVLKDKGEWVFERDTLALIEKREGTFHFFCFLPFKSSPYVKEGMEVYLELYGDKPQFLKGKVEYVSPFIISQDRMNDLLGNSSLIEFFTKGEPVVEVQIKSDQNIPIPPRSLAHSSIIISSRRVISYLIPRRRSA